MNFFNVSHPHCHYYFDNCLKENGCIVNFSPIQRGYVIMHTLKSTYAKKYYLRFAKIVTKLRFRKKLVNGVLKSLFYI